MYNFTQINWKITIWWTGLIVTSCFGKITAVVHFLQKNDLNLFYYKTGTRKRKMKTKKKYIKFLIFSAKWKLPYSGTFTWNSWLGHHGFRKVRVWRLFNFMLTVPISMKGEHLCNTKYIIFNKWTIPCNLNVRGLRLQWKKILKFLNFLKIFSYH